MSTGQIQHLEKDLVFASLHSLPQGLAGAEVAERLHEVGRNSFEVKDPWKIMRSLVKQFTNFFTILLVISAAICFVAHRVQPGESMNVLGWALLVVSLLNAFFSFFQEYRAERAMEELRKFLPQQVEVRRDGSLTTVPAEELVPGDLLLLTEGDRVPADARLVASHELLASNAPLTGEAAPVRLDADACERRLTESSNIVFAGCSIIRGSGEAVVYATGLRTEFGKLAHLSQAIARPASPLELETGRMVRTLTVIAVLMGTSFFVYGMASGRSLWVNLVFMMGIIVANVPEGLLPTFTLALAMGSLRMARKNVLVKSLNAVEALGAVHVICTDKTGTLTQNRLSITELQGPSTAGRLTGSEAGRILGLARIASEVRQTDKGPTGDPLDVAVHRALAEEAGGLKPPHGNASFYPFDVEKRRSAGIAEQEGRLLFAVKGAFEALRPLLDGLQAKGGLEATDDQALARAEEIMEEMACRGLRVIAVAWRELDEEERRRLAAGDEIGQEELENNLLLAGFLGIEDPIRPEVPEAVAICRRAGIEVVMVTGDHPDTAQAVAARSGITESGGDAAVVTGDLLDKLTGDQLIEKITSGVRIFARTTPEQKMKIVAAYKRMGLVAAMTGDGVNDAPALKAADVGIAMGREGTDVAREAAQIILLDDNFASIVKGIEEGRTVFANIRKFTNYVLVSNGPEILPYLLYILLPVPLALNVIQILSIDLGTDIIPSMALGQEPPDPAEMERPPRNREQGLLTRELICHSYLFLGLLEGAWSLGLFFYVLLDGGWRYGQELAGSDPLYRSATGIALSTILLMQIGNLIGRRYAQRSGLDRGLFRNPLLVAGILIQIVFSWATLYFPPLQRVLQTGPVPLHVYLLAWMGIFLIFGTDYLRKRIFLRPA